MVSDSRFDEDIKQKIEELHNGVLRVLSDENKFRIYFRKDSLITFEEGKTKQFRVYYRVEINKKNTRLNDLYQLVNSVKAVYYGRNWGD